nr:MAG TPA: triphosphate pyrophosphohydrolase [Caudoviricetes sp.]
MMIDGYLLNTRVFNKVNDDKYQALEPLEEAVEIFGAWQVLDSMRDSPFLSAWRDTRDDLIDECMDTVQATANLLAAIGATQGEVDAAIKRMDERNGDRGRL